MEMDQAKLFIGGISWDTNEDRLKEYFGAYGEVVEAVIMRDRTTGRARGFGFVVFANPSDAERVVKEKHIIDGRTVEAKKAVPRDDQNLITRNSGSSIHGSPGPGPGPGRTKKIFVGGLASIVTETDFKSYFEQFGTIIDAVVMYDHNTQRPRGFGFITYDSEDAVDRVLHKTFHELNNKMVEVKRAVPKELSPGPNRVGPLVGYNNFVSSYAQGHNLGSVGGYGGRYNLFASVRAGFSHIGSPVYAVGGLGGGSNFSSNQGYGRVPSPYIGSSPSRYATPIGYNPGGERSDPFLKSPSRNVWENGGGLSNPASNAGSGSYFGSGSGGFGVFGNNGSNWGVSTFASSSGYVGGDRGGENSYASGSGGGFGRSNTAGGPNTSSFAATSGDYEGFYGDFYRGGSVYGDLSWRNTSSELDNNGSFGYGLGNSEDVVAKGSEDYMVGYDVANRQSSRGIAA